MVPATTRVDGFRSGVMAAWGKECLQGRRAVGVSKIGRVRIVDVAREAGVSIATVDRVLNKRIGVRPVTTERVWSALAAPRRLD